MTRDQLIEELEQRIDDLPDFEDKDMELKLLLRTILEILK